MKNAIKYAFMAIFIIAIIIINFINYLDPDYISSNKLHWDHRNITYSLSGCTDFENGRINNSFNIIQNNINNLIIFKESREGNIEIICHPEVRKDREWDTSYSFIDSTSWGDISYNYSGNSISHARIEFYGIQSLNYPGLCSDFPVGELSSILYIMGIDEVKNSTSIMNPNSECVNKIDNEVIKDLKERYSRDKPNFLVSIFK